MSPYVDLQSHGIRGTGALACVAGERPSRGRLCHKIWLEECNQFCEGRIILECRRNCALNAASHKCSSLRNNFEHYIFVIVNVPVVQAEGPVGKLNVPFAMLPR
jgi:hypothetical protein